MSLRAGPSHRRARAATTGRADASFWIFAHKATFVAWFCAMSAHVLWYAPQLPRLLRARSRGTDRVTATVAGAGHRWLLLTAALAIGLVAALATYHLAGGWTGLLTHGGA